MSRGAMSGVAALLLIAAQCGRRESDSTRPSPTPSAPPGGTSSLSPGAPTEIVVGGSRGVRVVDAVTGEVLRTLSNRYGATDWQVQVSPDGGTVYFGREFTAFASPKPRAGILVVSRSGGRSVVIVSVRGLIDTFAVSPDGRWLAYTYGIPHGHGDYRESGLVIRDLTTGEEHRAPRVDLANPTWTPGGRTLVGSVERDGRFGVLVIDVTQPGRPRRERFLVPPPGLATGVYWSVHSFVRSHELLVREGCCFIPDDPEKGSYFELDEGHGTRWLLVDTRDGALLEEIPTYGRDLFYVDLDASGSHPLLGRMPYPCDDFCHGTLLRLDARGSLVDLDVSVMDADW